MLAGHKYFKDIAISCVIGRRAGFPRLLLRLIEREMEYVLYACSIWEY